jgi:hypothetical protein
MSREKVVLETPKVIRHIEYEFHIKCDKCDKVINYVTEEPNYRNELLVYLNPDECVHQQFRRDYCTKCLIPIWNKICEAIGADPNDDSRFDDDED